MNHADQQSTVPVPTTARDSLASLDILTAPKDKPTACGFCQWCLFNSKWHGCAFPSLCARRRVS
jgi:hypothetical protein